MTALRLSPLVGLLALGSLVVVAGGCGSDNPNPPAADRSASQGTPSPSTASSSTSPTLTIKNFKFTPEMLQAKVGDVVTVTNEDNTDHTVTADDHSFDTGRFSSGSMTFTVSHAGTFHYHCDVHNFMTGTIQVAAR